MIVLSTHALSFSVGDKDILTDIGFSLNEGDKLGVVGVNGAGKTTLFRLLTGEYTPSSGEVFLARERTLGWLRQDEASLPAGRGETLYDYVVASYEEPLALEAQIREEEEALAAAGFKDGDISELSEKDLW